MSTTHKTPWHEALYWINQHPTTGTAVGLAKLVLSFYNGNDYPFSFADCTRSFDSDRCALAQRMVSWYLDRGEDDSLRDVGYEIYKDFPRLAQLGQSASNAMADLRIQWREEDNAKLELEEVL